MSMQIELLQRKTTQIFEDCWLMPDFLTVEAQGEMLADIRRWTKEAGGLHAPLMPNGTPMNHSLRGLGWDWVPYHYEEIRRELPQELIVLANQALYLVDESIRDRYTPFNPDTALVNWFPLGSSLGSHQDKSEDDSLVYGGSPIVTLAIGAACDLYVGGDDRGDPMTKVEMRSGDIFVMAGTSRRRFHEVRRILPDTTPPDLSMKTEGRISVTIRRAKAPHQEIQPAR
ncbi:MAG: alpha-ketoglutarate-dependent dioxygenase AlkB [Cyanobacteria bacterium P01_H01_bin.121]